MGIEDSGRFTIRATLGRGGYGQVYRAYDAQRREEVAIKTLRVSHPQALYRLKQEFRSLAQLVHPNLIRLHELFADDDGWYFTMELLLGVTLMDYIRGGRGWKQAAETAPASGPNATSTTQQVSLVASESGPKPVVEEAPPGDGTRKSLEDVPVALPKLIPALQQLCTALHAVHERGKLHRDIKPGNVMVTTDGRTVLLDFGLVSEVAEGGLADTSSIAGTACYMAPEQFGGKHSTSSDWYSVGAVIYEALVGRQAYGGSPVMIMQAKQAGILPPPSRFVAGIPEWLDDLCMRLLAQEPSRRATGEEVLAVFEREAGPVQLDTGAAAPAARLSTEFVGRKKQLATLLEAYHSASAGKVVVASVSGESGMGKSALISHFLDSLAQETRPPVILRSRCYELESVPFKALDGAVDALSQHLRYLGDAEANALLPRHVAALARLFPVLERIHGIASAPPVGSADDTGAELRRRAFKALRDLFAAMADRGPLVLYIDDLQWSDADSIELLEVLLLPPDPPHLLLVVSHRPDSERAGALRRALAPADQSAESELALFDVAIGELSEEEATELARHLLEQRSPDRVELSASIARESGGMPMFIDALTQRVSTQDTLKTSERASLEVVLQDQVADLSEAARALIETLAVAALPLSSTLAMHAASVGRDGREALSELRQGGLVQAMPSRDGATMLRMRHDRVLQAVSRSLDGTRTRALNEALANVLEGADIDDPERLAIHFRAAGRDDRAAHYAIEAAHKAYAALAFDRASRLFERALELAPEHGQASLFAHLASAQANAGRCGDAGATYVRAAESESGDAATDLYRMAAEQYLVGGYHEPGLKAIDHVVDALGMKLPRTGWRSLLTVGFNVIRLRWRGLEFAERDASEVDDDVLRRLDCWWTITVGLIHFDAIRSYAAAGKQLEAALRAGEPYRVIRALGMEAIQTAALGSRRQWCAKVMARCYGLAERIRSPETTGMVHLADGVRAVVESRFVDGLELLARTEELAHESLTTGPWTLDNAPGLIRRTARVYQMQAQSWMGRWRDLGRDLPTYLNDAQQNGDAYYSTSLLLLATPTNLMARDQPEGIHAIIDEALLVWDRGPFVVQHFMHANSYVDGLLYMGRGDEAHRWLVGRWKQFKKYHLFQILVISAALAVLISRSPKGDTSERFQTL